MSKTSCNGCKSRRERTIGSWDTWVSWTLAFTSWYSTCEQCSLPKWLDFLNYCRSHREFTNCHRSRPTATLNSAKVCATSLFRCANAMVSRKLLIDGLMIYNLYAWMSPVGTLAHEPLTIQALLNDFHVFRLQFRPFKIQKYTCNRSQ